MKLIYGFYLLFVFCAVHSGAERSLTSWTTEENDFDVTSTERNLIDWTTEENVFDLASDDPDEYESNNSTFNESTACEGYSQLIDNNTVIVESPGYPEPYPVNHETNCSAWFWVVTTSGYNVDILLEKFNICAICNDSVIVSPGTSLQRDETSAIFTGSVNQYQRIQVMEHSSVYILFITQNRTFNDYEGFRLIISGNGTLPTTEPPTTIPPSSSTVPPDIPTDITVYIYGKHSEDFLAIMTSFQTAVADMANIYCDSNNIQLSRKVTYSDVQIFLVQQCPTTWPEWDMCTAVTMAVPVILANNPENRYELTTNHLEEMWSIHAQNNSMMMSLGLKVYEEPETRQVLLMWLYLGLGIILMFMIILFAGWLLLVHVHKRESSFGKKDGISITSRESTDSWASNNTYQQVPPLTDLYQGMESNENLQPPDLASQEPRVSDGQFAGVLRFSTLRKGYDNEAYDNASELEHAKPRANSHEHDFSSDEEIDTTKIERVKYDPVYEDPNPKLAEDKESESVL